jgi:hypothetical protein
VKSPANPKEQKQIPYGNDRKKGRDKGEGGGLGLVDGGLGLVDRE